MSPLATTLARTHTLEELEALADQVAAAMLARGTVNIHINASSRPDGRASSGITLANYEEQERMLGVINFAIEVKSGNTDGREMPRFTDFSYQMTRV